MFAFLQCPFSYVQLCHSVRMAWPERAIKAQDQQLHEAGSLRFEAALWRVDGTAAVSHCSQVVSMSHLYQHDTGLCLTHTHCGTLALLATGHIVVIRCPSPHAFMSRRRESRFLGSCIPARLQPCKSLAQWNQVDVLMSEKYQDSSYCWGTRSAKPVTMQTTTLSFLRSKLVSLALSALYTNKKHTLTSNFG